MNVFHNCSYFVDVGKIMVPSLLFSMKNNLFQSQLRSNKCAKRNNF